MFALSYVRNVMDNTRLVEGNPYFEAVARHEGFYSTELMEQLAETGSLEKLDVPQWVKDVFRTSHDISPEWHVRMQAAFQSHTDNSVSKTINFPITPRCRTSPTLTCWPTRPVCKGITVYRDGSKADQVLSTGETGKQAEGETAAGLPDQSTGHRTPRERPRQIRGVTERVRTGHGNMYITINFDDETGGPFELFSALGKAGGCDSAHLEAISAGIPGPAPPASTRRTSSPTCAGLPAAPPGTTVRWCVPAPTPWPWSWSGRPGRDSPRRRQPPASAIRLHSRAGAGGY